MADIGTVAGLVEYLKTLPQDAVVYLADGESYRFKEDVPDWDEESNVYYPLDVVQVRRGQTGQEKDEAFLQSNERSRAKGFGHVTNPETFPPSEDEPATLVVLVGSR